MLTTAIQLDAVSTLDPFPEGERYQWRVCQHPGCNTIFKCYQAGGASPYCNTHAKLHDDPQGTQNRKEHQRHRETHNLTVLYSPEDFKAGNTFPFHEFCYGLEAGVWPVSMRVGYRESEFTVRADSDTYIAFGGNNTSGAIDQAACLTHHPERYDFDSETFITNCLTPWDHETKRIHNADGVMATLAGSDGGGGQRMPYVAYPIDTRNALRTTDPSEMNRQGVGVGDDGDPSPTLTDVFTPGVGGTFGVRRLTPTECERLQGFPDGWTDGQADSSRYRQLGNAVCVNVLEWIGRRILEAEGVR